MRLKNKTLMRLKNDKTRDPQKKALTIFGHGKWSLKAMKKAADRRGMKLTHYVHYNNWGGETEVYL